MPILWYTPYGGATCSGCTDIDSCNYDAYAIVDDGSCVLHDIGDILAPANHSQVAAALLRPYVSERNAWIIEHHGLFQGYYYFHHIEKDRHARDRYCDHPHYQACVDFCEYWDQRSFDPKYCSKPLAYFEPMVRRLFARNPAEFV